jgi:hypothetical protein
MVGAPPLLKSKICALALLDKHKSSAQPKAKVVMERGLIVWKLLRKIIDGLDSFERRRFTFGTATLEVCYA